MKLGRKVWLRAEMSVRAGIVLLVLLAAFLGIAPAQAPTTTTVTGTVYLANGQPGSGTLVVSWPGFTTAAGQLVAADSLSVTIPSDGFVSVDLAPNQGATPAGEYYTAVFYMSDGSSSTQYWLVPAASSATLAAVQAQVMPAAQAVQTVSKAYVDEAISELTSSEITSSGGTLTGPLYLSGDPTQPLQAADKHYVDTGVAADLPLTGGTVSGPLTVRNSADAEVDYTLWPGLTASQKGSFTYDDWNGNSQWSMLKDASNNWALNSAVGGLDSFKAFQSTNSGDTYMDASNSTGHIRLNYESGSGSETDIYSSGTLDLKVAGTTSIEFPGLAASSGTNCLQVDSSGNLSNTGSPCGSGGGGGGSGTVNSGTTGQIAFYSASGTAVAGNAATVSSSGAGAFAGLEDTAGPDVPSYLQSGSDEGTRLQNAIDAAISSPGAGRAVSEAVPTRQSAVTWNANPFASLLNTNGSGNTSGVYQLAVKIQPWQVVTTSMETDLGFNALLDCGNTYGPYQPSLGVGGTIQPESSGYPTTTLVTDGPSTGATANTAYTQGNKIDNCAFYANGVSGMTALNLSWGQEGTQTRNNRITGFMVGINRDASATSGGAQHNFGIYDTQVELSDSADSTVWGVRVGYNSASAMNGVIENLSAIGGSNANGVTKIALENDASGLSLKNLVMESDSYGILNNNVHSAGNGGNSFDTVVCNPANAPVFACAVDGSAGPNYGAVFRNISGGTTLTLQEKNQPTAAIRQLHGDPNVASYSFTSAGPVVVSANAQAASVNGAVGVSYGNIAAWPSLYLPAKTNPLTLSSATTEGAQYMTASDVSAGVIPAGIVHNGDLAAATTSTYHSVAVTASGLSACIFDGATTADDYVTLSSSAVSGSAVGCHDTGSQTPPSSGVSLGKVRKSVSAAPSAPSMGTVTTNCSTSCTTTYTYVWVQKASSDPFDLTQSAPSSNGTVSSAATLTTSVYNTIPGCSTATSSSPCWLFETAGPYTGFLTETISTANVLDNGLRGDGSSPFSSGILAPPVSVRVQSALAAGYASNSAVGLAQCDGVTITCGTGGVLSTAAGATLTHWSVAGGMMNTSEQISFASTANDQYAQDVDIPAQLNFNQMCVDVTTDDTTSGDVYNIALVKLTTPSCTGSSCATTTVAYWSAAQAFSSTGTKCEANAEGNVTVAPGNYYLITTGNAATAKLAGTSSSGQKWTALSSVAAGTSSSGAFGTITLNVLSSGATQISGAQTQVALTLTQ
jgi:hypothetical protein